MSEMTTSDRARRDREIDVLARTIYGEARGEPVRGKEAVACVILNRVRRARRRGGYWWGSDLIEVCHKPWQFSCWNEDDPNLEKILKVDAANSVFKTCKRVARRALGGSIKDPTDGATHYHAIGVEPPWAKGRGVSAAIGRHVFYNNVE